MDVAIIGQSVDGDALSGALSIYLLDTVPWTSGAATIAPKRRSWAERLYPAASDLRLEIPIDGCVAVVERAILATVPSLVVGRRHLETAVPDTAPGVSETIPVDLCLIYYLDAADTENSG